jgi:hypothetical protein
MIIAGRKGRKPLDCKVDVPGSCNRAFEAFIVKESRGDLLSLATSLRQLTRVL